MLFHSISSAVHHVGASYLSSDGDTLLINRLAAAGSGIIGFNAGFCHVDHCRFLASIVDITLKDEFVNPHRIYFSISDYQISFPYCAKVVLFFKRYGYGFPVCIDNNDSHDYSFPSSLILPLRKPNCILDGPFSLSLASMSLLRITLFNSIPRVSNQHICFNDDGSFGGFAAFSNNTNFCLFQRSGKLPSS